MAHDGYDFLLRLGGTAITGRIGSEIDMNWDEIPATTVDSQKSAEFLTGTFNGTVTANGQFTDGDTYSVAALKTAGDARTPVAMLWGKLTDEAKRFSANVLVTNVHISANMNETPKYSCTLRITGTLNISTYTTNA